MVNWVDAQRIDLLTSEAQYLIHALPTFQALPPELQGSLYSGRWANPPIPMLRGTPKPRSLVLVASLGDHKSVVARRGQTIFVEHGAGQTYVGIRRGEYAGGRKREGAILFLCPSERIANLNRERYPSIPSVVVGSPALDALLVRGPAPPPKPEKILGLSFHSDLQHLLPETRSALPHYRGGLIQACERLRQAGWSVLGHGHPRLWNDKSHDLAGVWRACGAEPVRDFSEVCRRASVYAVDNSSTGFEYAATTGPVVMLDAPWYRRDVEHGLRFWSHVPGERISGPDELPEAVERAFNESPDMHAQRLKAVTFAYDSLDGKAAERAALAIAEVVCSTNGPKNS